MTKLLLAASAAVLIAGPALAAEPQADAPSRTVSTRGVDFSNGEQVRQFYFRLNVAARAACDGSSPVPRFFATDARCVRRAVADAVKAADKPMLTALYESTADSNRAFAGNDQ